ncbi:MAG: lipopolysaccharide export system permease protein [Saprospiraceae bacterium]|jgi:lipopolysaccharide export system permease protein
MTLFVTNFLLLMIWFWKYLEDIVGKGIELGVIAELVGYASLNQVPLSLPLAILLSSIMTYGKLGETVELTAIKSLGISLWRAMFPLILLVTIFTGLAFVFSNNVLPRTNKNLKMLLRDVSRQKPELSIPEGVFYNQLDGYSIRIGKKYPDKTLKDIIIFQNKLDNNRFITADSGRMELGNDGNLLVLTLIDGNAYDQESEAGKINQQKSYPLVHNHFKENQIIFDLESFKFVRKEKGNYSSNSKMRNISELEESIDSMELQIAKRSLQLYDDLNRNFYFTEDSTISYDTITPYPLSKAIILHNFDSIKWKQVLHHATDIARNAKNYVHSSSMVLHNQKKIQNRHKVEFHRKFTLSFACILLFFVGAPFGAIVKKGGLGAPVIISVFLFLTFHVLSIVGEKLAKNGSWEAYEGMWMATLILLPVGIFLTYKATSDSAIFNPTAYKKFFLKLVGKK